MHNHAPSNFPPEYRVCQNFVLRTLIISKFITTSNQMAPKEITHNYKRILYYWRNWNSQIIFVYKLRALFSFLCWTRETAWYWFLDLWKPRHLSTVRDFFLDVATKPTTVRRFRLRRADAWTCRTTVLRRKVSPTCRKTNCRLAV